MRKFLSRNLNKKKLVNSPAYLQQSAACLAITCPPVDPPENVKFTFYLEQGYGLIVPIAVTKVTF